MEKILITPVLISLSGPKQYPGVSGNTHEWSGGCKGWKEGVRKCGSMDFRLQLTLL